MITTVRNADGKVLGQVKELKRGITAKYKQADGTYGCYPWTFQSFEQAVNEIKRSTGEK
jgi:hypothetical protein